MLLTNTSSLDWAQGLRQPDRRPRAQVETKRTRDQRVALEAKDRIIGKLREQLGSMGTSSR